MLITRTPYRISFFGGGTDYSAWFREHGGEVLATTIDKFSYISCRHLPPFFEHKYRIVWSRIECVKDISEIKHPAVRAILELENSDNGFEIHHFGDLPARSGLGSSSAFTVGLINALTNLRGLGAAKEYLAKSAINVEQNVIKENVGSQDQICAAYGSFNHIGFAKDYSFEVSPMLLPPERLAELESHLLLIFTGLQRNAPEIAKAQIENIGNRKQELTLMQEMVTEAMAILQSAHAPVIEFGALLHHSWEVKRRLAAGISNDDIDTFYAALRKIGVIGGKLCGAGGGGFMLLFAPPERQAGIKALLEAHKFIHIPFKFETEGSKVVLNQSNGM